MTPAHTLYSCFFFFLWRRLLVVAAWPRPSGTSPPRRCLIAAFNESIVMNMLYYYYSIIIPHFPFETPLRRRCNHPLPSPRLDDPIRISNPSTPWAGLCMRVCVYLPPICVGETPKLDHTDRMARLCDGNSAQLIPSLRSWRRIQ